MPAAPEAFYFGPPDRPLMGFWHAPRAPAQPLAVVLVGPWGIEGMNLQRTWRHFAQDLAAQGFPVLRFDLDGCGDAHSPPSDTDLWPLWMDAVSQARQTTLARTGLGCVALVGFRQGALLAAHHAHMNPSGVHSLVLMAPMRSGHACVRELKMLEASIGQAPAAAPWALVAAGFGMNEATAHSLKQVKLPTGLPGVCVSVVDRLEAPVGSAWTEALAATGARTTHVVVPGYPGMMRIAHEVTPAAPFFNEALKCLSDAVAALPPHTPAPNPHARPCAPCCTLPPPQGHGTAVREWATPPFGAAGMVAVVARPEQSPSDKPRSGKAILVLNSGAEHRVGPNRRWVDWARDMAAQGHTVVRLDLPGLGESNGDPTQASTQVYRDDTLHHIGKALDWLDKQLNVTRWAVMGLCSGAYHAMGVALRDARVERVVAINPFVFFPAQLRDIDLLAGNAMQHMVAAHTLKSAKDPQRWLRLLRGESNIRLIVQSLAGRTRTKLVKQGLDLGRRLRLVPPTPLATSLTTATARGCRFHFVFDINEPGWAILKEDIGGLADRMLANGRFTLDTIPNGGHSFATLEGRAKMLACTQAHLQAWANPTN